MKNAKSMKNEKLKVKNEKFLPNFIIHYSLFIFHSSFFLVWAE